MIQLTNETVELCNWISDRAEERHYLEPSTFGSGLNPVRATGSGRTGSADYGSCFMEVVVHSLSSLSGHDDVAA